MKIARRIKNRAVTTEWPPPNERVHLDLQDIEASKAVFMGAGEHPRIRVAMTTTAGQVVDFEMDMEQATKMLEQVTYSYRAAFRSPRLRTETFGL